MTPSGEKGGDLTSDTGEVVCGRLGVEGDRRFDIIGRAVNDLFMKVHGEFALSEALQQRLKQAPGSS